MATAAALTLLRSHVYAVKPISEPNTTRYAMAQSEPGVTASHAGQRSCSMNELSSSATAPPPSICITLAAAIDGGRSECFATMVPEAHARVLQAASSTPMKSSSLPVPPQPGAPRTATPPSPHAMPRMIVQLGAPARVMMRSSVTIHTLVMATMSAAMPLGIRCTPEDTRTLAMAKSRAPAMVQLRHQRRRAKSERCSRRVAKSTAAMARPPMMKRMPESNAGGKLAMANLLPRYVEPHRT